MALNMSPWFLLFDPGWEMYPVFESTMTTFWEKPPSVFGGRILGSHERWEPGVSARGVCDGGLLAAGLWPRPARQSAQGP